MEKRVTGPINPAELRVEVTGKRPLCSGGLLVRLSDKKDAEILERAILENEGLRETVKFTIPKLRRSRIICFDVPDDVTGEDVVDAVLRQSGSEEGSVKINDELGFGNVSRRLPGSD